MSASPPEVPNDHKNYSETNSIREKKSAEEAKRTDMSTERFRIVDEEEQLK